MPFTFEPADSPMLRAVLDAMPSVVLVMNEDVRIIDANRAAFELVPSLPRDVEPPLRPGETLRCLHAHEHPEGCGHSPACESCVIRGAVSDALVGNDSRRLRTRMSLRLNDRRQEVYLQITASGFQYQAHHLALLVLEDISEFMELRGIVPICAQCKKIRQDENYWQSVEHYVGRYMDLSFSHSYCPACKQDILGAIDATPVTLRDSRPRTIEG